MRLKMKVAGSSWSLWWLLLCNCAGLLFGAITVVDSSDVGQCEPLNSQTQIEFDNEDNLIEELASASKDTGKVPSLLDDTLKNYDATPFWYNLIQAISLASGITPTTEALMHDLVTSSFSSDNLNGSIKKVLTAIKCNENKTTIQETDQTPNQSLDGADAAIVEVRSKDTVNRASLGDGGDGGIRSDSDATLDELLPPTAGGRDGGSRGYSDATLEDHRPPMVGGGDSGSRAYSDATLEDHRPPMVGGGDGGSRGYSDATLEDHRPPEPPQFVDAQKWNPWDRILSALWDREQEWTGNDLIGPVPGVRLRRELRDRRRESGAMPDRHQPFFMSEVVPSSLVTRHPSIISVSGCPSGHIQDLRGICRQIFQYTVNYGGGANPGSAPSSPFGQPGERGSRPWLFGGRRPAPQPSGGSLRDVARESSLFKHSVMRGYVPPFIFSQAAGARNLQARLGLNPRPQPTLVGNSVDGAALDNSAHSPMPSPIELMKTKPQIMMIEEEVHTFPPKVLPPRPSTTTSQPTTTTSRKEKGDDNKTSKGEWSSGGGSSEHFDSSSSRSKEEKRREDEAKAARKAKDKQSNDDDD